MNNILKLSSLAILMVFAIGACKKKEVTRRTILAENAVGSVLSQNVNSVKIDTAKLADKAITMDWTKTDWGFYEANSTYYLQLAKANTPWDASTGVLSFPMEKSLMASFTHESLNEVLENLGFTRDVAADLKSRIKTTLDNDTKILPVYSNDLITKVTPVGTTAINCAELSQTVTDVDVDKTNLDSTANKLKWTATDYGYAGLDVVYTLEMTAANADWDMPGKVTIDLGPSLEKSFTNLEINDMAIDYGFAIEQSSAVKSRIVAKVNNNSFYKPCTSNELITNVTPKALIGYLWVPGDYQGWNPGAAGKLTSAIGNGEYTGTIEFVYPNGGSGSNEFKFTSHPNWDNTNYGGTVSSNGGTLSTTGGNLMLPAQGTYLLTANTNTFTWTYELANWGIIGSATPTGWGSDSDLKYDNATGKYSTSIFLTGGNEIKFRKNDDWGTNLGDDNTDGSLEPNGANIPIAVDGTYTVTLDVENKTYSIQ